MSISHLRLGAAAAALAFALTSLASVPALADPPPWAPAHGHRDKHHGRDDDDDAPRVIVTQPPPVVVAPAAPVYVAPPPAVIYQPAPAVVAPSPSIDIIVPLHIGH